MSRARSGGATLRPAAALLLLLAGCQSPPPTRAALPVLQPADVDPAAGFEAPPQLSASDLLPEALREGPHFHVREDVATDGFLHLYTLESDYGDFEVASDELLRSRVREIGALAALHEMGRTREFAAAVSRGLASPFVAAWNLVTSPVESLWGIPKGAYEQVQRAAALTRSERGAFEDRALKEFIGFEAKKRALAAELGVDPYSTNPKLQRELNRVAWAGFAGGFAFSLVPFQGGPETEPEPATASRDAELAALLASEAPEDLRRRNRIELALMGVEPDLADRFLAHPWLSPRHQTIAVASLAALDLARDRSAFFEAALTSRAEIDALVYQRIAELLRAIDQHEARVVRLGAEGRLVRAWLADGRRITPVEVDHLIWSRPTAALVEAGAAPSDDAPGGREIWLTGTASPLARREIEAHGYRLVERAFERLARQPGPPGADRAGAAP